MENRDDRQISDFGLSGTIIKLSASTSDHSGLLKSLLDHL
jgi:hypothetical protein